MSVVIELMDRFSGITDEVVYRDVRLDDHWSPEVLEDRQPGETVKKFILRWIDGRREDFMGALSEAEEINENSLVIYRCMDVGDPRKFLFMLQRGLLAPPFRGIGIFWSWDLEASECHWGGGGKPIYIKALVPLKSRSRFESRLRQAKTGAPRESRHSDQRE